tara:strand:+ start:435 stop:2249 length:1815 start_codon:yes stop_codon:yes gene_type:complete
MGSLVAELAEKLSSATNNFDIDEGTIYVNTSADTVGIGTTSPGSKFDVQGTMQVGVNDTGHDVKFFGATAGAYLEWDESADELELRGGAATPGKLLLSTAETTVVDGNKLGQIDFQAPLDSAGTDAILVGASIYAEADATFSASVNATELVFATGASETATEKVRIDSVGRVGIGTTAPDVNALLHIKTSLDSVNLLVESTEAGASISGFGINMYRNSSSPADNDNIAALRYIGRNDNSQDVTYGAMYGQIIDASDGTEDGALHIQTMKAGSLTTTMSAISGQVGIGTTAPDTNLSVTDGGTDTQTLVDISVFNDQTGYSPDLIFRKSHNDTIGTKTATTDNTILGRIIFNGVDSGTNFDWGAYIQATQDGTASGQIPAELSFYTSDGTSIAERIIIKKDGKVGIGTSAPAEMLEVYNTDSPAIQLNDGGDYQSIIRLAGNDLEIRGSSGKLELYNGGADGDASTVMLQLDGSTQVEMLVPFIQDIATHQKIRQFYYSATINNGNSVDLFRNTNGYDDLNGLMWLESTHSGRTYRTFVFTIGGYGFNHANGGDGSLTLEAGGGYPGGTNALRVSNSTGYNANVWLAGFLFGDSAVTSINATIYD